MIENLNCSGDENHIAACNFREWGHTLCDIHDAVGISCGNNRHITLKIFLLYKRCLINGVFVWCSPIWKGGISPFSNFAAKTVFRMSASEGTRLTAVKS